MPPSQLRGCRLPVGPGMTQGEGQGARWHLRGCCWHGPALGQKRLAMTKWPFLPIKRKLIRIKTDRRSELSSVSGIADGAVGTSVAAPPPCGAMVTVPREFRLHTGALTLCCVELWGRVEVDPLSHKGQTRGSGFLTGSQVILCCWSAEPALSGCG